MAISYHTFYPGAVNAPDDAAAGKALLCWVEEAEPPEASYAQMMRFRLQGEAFPECRDAYFAALDETRCVSRVWHGWGKHADAIGNFGNFRTAQDHQHQGIGRVLLDRCFSELQTAKELPLALFCSAGAFIAPAYRKYGFHALLPGTDHGPLYCPLGDSPRSFAEFCRQYYHPAEKLQLLPGTIGFRHEIDLLLKFALAYEGRNFGLSAFPSYEAAYLAIRHDRAAGVLERVALPDGHTVGWAFTAPGGEREMQLHPAYCDTPIH